MEVVAALGTSRRNRLTSQPVCELPETTGCPPRNGSGMHSALRIRQWSALDHQPGIGRTHRLRVHGAQTMDVSVSGTASHLTMKTQTRRTTMQHRTLLDDPTLDVPQSVTAPLRKTFEDLANEWLRERPRGVDVARMTQHPAYQGIVGMGAPAVPWILQRLAHKPDHWFVALSTITGANPVPPASRGRLHEMTAAWLDWGRQQGYGTLVDVA